MRGSWYWSGTGTRHYWSGTGEGQRLLVRYWYKPAGTGWVLVQWVLVGYWYGAVGTGTSWYWSQTGPAEAAMGGWDWSRTGPSWYWFGTGLVLVQQKQLWGGCGVQYWSQTGLLLVLYWSWRSRYRVAVGCWYWSCTGPILVLVSYWSHTGPILVLALQKWLQGGCGVLVLVPNWSGTGPVLVLQKELWGGCGVQHWSQTGLVLVLQKQLWGGCGVLVLVPYWSGTGPVLVLQKRLWGVCGVQYWSQTGLVLVLYWSRTGTGPVEAAMGWQWGAGTGPSKGQLGGLILVPVSIVTGGVLHPNLGDFVEKLGFSIKILEFCTCPGDFRTQIWVIFEKNGGFV